jgi:outer membrane protein assembly factor BamB
MGSTNFYMRSVVFGDHVYMAMGEHVYKLEAATGNEIWKANTGPHNNCAVSVDGARGYAYISSDGDFKEIDLASGAFETVASGETSKSYLGPGLATAGPEAGTLALVSGSGQMYAYQKSAGTGWKWTTAVGHGNKYEGPQPTYYQGHFYQAGDAGVLTKINALTGAEAWTFQGARSRSTPVVFSDTIFFGSTSNKFFAVNLDGTLKWKDDDTDGRINEGGAAGRASAVYIYQDATGLVSYHKDTGTKMWTRSSSSYSRSAVLVSPMGPVFYSDADGFHAVN